MKMLFASMLLLAATAAQASVQGYQPDVTNVRPVSLAEAQRESSSQLQRSCQKPVMIFMRDDDGTARLIGVIVPKDHC